MSYKKIYYSTLRVFKLSGRYHIFNGLRVFTSLLILYGASLHLNTTPPNMMST